MVQTKTINKAVKGEIIGMTYRQFGSQWVLVHAVEVGETHTSVTVQFPNHCGNGAILTLKRQNDKRVNWQTFEEHDAWRKMNKIDRWTKPE